MKGQNHHLSSSGPVVLSDSPVKEESIWIPKLDLYQHDKAILQCSAWLNDGIIHAAQRLLQKQTKGEIFGWQSTQCAKNSSLPPQSPFVQVLHVGDCHWIVVSNLHLKDGQGLPDSIAYYDFHRPHIINF